MMTNRSTDVIIRNSHITELNRIQVDIGQYLYPIIFILGNIGTILNVIILTQRVYLRNSCSCYILASSVTNLLIINMIVLFHMLAQGFSIDPTKTSLFFCRFRQYVSHILTLLSRIYIVLACADRWTMSSTSVRRRAFSQIKVARILIPSIAIGWCIISIHIPFYFNIINGQCIVQSGNYSIFYNIYNTILSGILTPMFMIIFGFLTIRNIKRSRQRVNIHRNFNRIYNQQQSREYEILIMILVQLGVYLVTCLPFPIYLIYSTVTIKWTKSEHDMARDRFFSAIAYVLANINFSATFYIYILTTRVFRKDLKRRFVENRLFRYCFIKQQNLTMNINPIIGTIQVNPLRTNIQDNNM